MGSELGGRRSSFERAHERFGCLARQRAPGVAVEFGEHVRKTQDSLRVLAEQTGGIAVVNQNNFDKALKRIDAETSDYYMLGYSSTNPDPLKRTRKLEVKLVNRPGVSV